MIPQIDNALDTDLIEIITYPNLTYKYNEYQIAGKVDDLEAIEQAIQHILSVERYAYLIYDDNYGVEFEKYIGQDMSYLEATIEDTLKEALTQDDRIVDVQVTDIKEEIVKQQLIDKKRVYKFLETENNQEIVTEEEILNISTEGQKILTNSTVTEVKVAIVEFDVYCKQGVIHTEVKVNVWWLQNNFNQIVG